MKAFTDFYTAAGGSVPATETAPVGTTDFRALLTKIKGTSPDAIYFGGVVTEAGPCAPADGRTWPQCADDRRRRLPRSGVHQDRGRGGRRHDVRHRQGTGQSEAREDAEGLRGCEVRRAVGPYTKNAFDAANIIIEALKTAGTKDKAAIAKAIRDIKYDGALGVTSFDENGQTKRPVELELREVKDGAWTTRQ